MHCVSKKYKSKYELLFCFDLKIEIMFNCNYRVFYNVIKKKKRPIGILYNKLV